MSEILESLFGSRSRSRILRFYALNPGQDFLAADVAKKNMVQVAAARKDLAALTRIGFLKEKKRKNKKYYTLNEQFSYFPELKSLFVKASTYPQCAALKKVRGVGKVHLALVSGVFLNYHRSKVDFFIVADNVSRSKLNRLVKEIEAEIGKEVRYMLLSGEEMAYRMNMMDRFLMEFLSAPHDEVINKMPKVKTFINDFKN